MASTPADICNYALVKAEDNNRITDLNTTDSDQAKKCTLLFPLVRDAVLRSHPWNCATKRATLSQLTDAPLFEYSYAYSLPSDCLRVHKLYGTDEAWQVEGRTLITNSSSAQIIYIYKNENVASYDALLVEAIATKLAQNLAAPLGINDKLVRDLLAQYQYILAIAKQCDGQEGTTKPIRIKKGWLQQRRHYRNIYNPDG